MSDAYKFRYVCADIILLPLICWMLVFVMVFVKCPYCIQYKHYKTEYNTQPLLYCSSLHTWDRHSTFSMTLQLHICFKTFHTLHHHFCITTVTWSRHLSTCTHILHTLDVALVRCIEEKFSRWTFEFTASGSRIQQH